MRAEASERQGEADEAKEGNLAWTAGRSNELVKGVLPGGGQGNPSSNQSRVLETPLQGRGSSIYKYKGTSEYSIALVHTHHV